MMDGRIVPEKLRAALDRLSRARGAGGSLWKEIRCLESVGSTQQLLDSLERQGVPEGSVVIAREQTAGRGRHGRSWHSPPGLGLTLSALLRPDSPGSLVLYSLGAAVAACEAVRSLDVPAEIKWPNDLVISGRKVGGLLVEGRMEGERIRAVLIGCGLNVSHTAADLPPENAPNATSLAMALGEDRADVTLLCARLLDRLDELTLLGKLLGIAPLLEIWRRLSPSSEGCAVTVREAGRLWPGVTMGIGEDGGLRVRDADGKQRSLRMTEEISIRQEAACFS